MTTVTSADALAFETLNFSLHVIRQFPVTHGDGLQHFCCARHMLLFMYSLIIAQRFVPIKFLVGKDTCCHLTFLLIVLIPFHYRFRIQSDKKVAVCSVHPSEQATLQCIGCIKAKVPLPKSYHCSSKCFSDAWSHHRTLHERAANAVNDGGNEEDEMFGRFNSTGSGVSTTSLSGSVSLPSMSNVSTAMYPAVVTQRSGGETWFEVGRSKTYTPMADDIGHVLKFECCVVDIETKTPVGPSSTLLTSRVIPAPSPMPRRLISLTGANSVGRSDSEGRLSTSGTFSVLSYNILADSYASNEMYSYCPSWALSWPYRRQNLLREIVGYRADIVCLQEVICVMFFYLGFCLY